MSRDPARRTLIVGATSAIACEVAVLCAERGDRLFLIGRDADKLERVRTRCGDAVVGVLCANLNAFGDAAARVAHAIDRLGGLDRALIAHGLLPDQRRTETDVALARSVIDTNLVSPVSLLLPLAEHMEQQGSGHIAVITSVAGVRGRPRNYTYGAAKSGLTCYLQGLRSRLYATGVRVHDIRLGPVATPMSEGHPQNFLWGEKVAVARGIVAAMERRWFDVYLPRRWRLVMAVVRWLPEFVFQRFGFLAGR